MDKIPDPDDDGQPTFNDKRAADPYRKLADAAIGLGPRGMDSDAMSSLARMITADSRGMERLSEIVNSSELLEMSRRASEGLAEVFARGWPDMAQNALAQLGAAIGPHTLEDSVVSLRQLGVWNPGSYQRTTLAGTSALASAIPRAQPLEVVERTAPETRAEKRKRAKQDRVKRLETALAALVEAYPTITVKMLLNAWYSTKYKPFRDLIGVKPHSATLYRHWPKTKAPTGFSQFSQIRDGTA